MSPTHAYARRFVMANWRGILFHCFDIDRHLTGLQGQNGSGKTTVMAAYITAMVPNQRLLNFPNITADGSSAKGDAGLWGRLEDGPAYTLIEWVTPRNQVLWAGVALTRGNMPSIEMKPFIVEGLPEVVSPYDAFIVRQGHTALVPPLPRLREHLTVMGARVTVQRTVADYMRCLYEQGITPMQMATHEEQERFYRVLSTSMAGSSLSSLASTGLRDYLLPEDATLERRVLNMRNSLEQCRLTRRELEHAQAAHAEILGLHEAAWGMASCAYFGATGRVAQVHQGWKEQARSTRDKIREVSELERQVHLLQDAHEQLQGRARELKGLRDARAEACSRAEQARETRLRLEKAQVRHDETGAARHEAERLRADARRALEEARIENDAALAASTDLARQLADMEQAVEALIQKVNLLRAARRKLAAAQQALGRTSVGAHNADALRIRLQDEYDRLTGQAAAMQAELDAFERTRQDFHAALDRVHTIARAEGTEPPAAHEAHAWASRLDARLRDHEFAAQHFERLATELAQARQKAHEQSHVRAKAAALDIGDGQALREALGRLNDEAHRLEAQRSVQQAELRRLEASLVRSRAALPNLAESVRLHELGQKHRLAVRAALPRAALPGSFQELRVLKDQLQRTMQERWTARTAAESAERATQARLHGLRERAGDVDAAVGSVAEHLDGHLLASHFDELTAEEAAATEARLGPWVQAIVVGDPMAAAHQAAQIGERPDTLLLLSEDAARAQREALALGDSELVSERSGGAFEGLRLTRRPQRPVLGRKAREQEIARLEEEFARQRQHLAALRDETISIEKAMAIVNEWIGVGPDAWAEDPLPALMAEEARVKQLTLAIQQAQSLLGRLQDETTQATARKRRLGEIEPFQALLDAPDWAHEAQRLDAASRMARQARKWLDQHAAAARQVVCALYLLARVPDEAVRERLHEQAGRLKAEREATGERLTLLGELVLCLPHLQYAAHEQTYEQNASIRTALREQIEPARQRCDAARAVYGLSRTRADEAQDSFNRADAVHQAARASRDELALQLEASGLVGSQAECDIARHALREAEQALERAGREKDEQFLLLDRTRTRHAQESASLEDKRRELHTRLATLRAERRTRNELRALVEQLRYRGRIDSEANRQQYFPHGNPINAFQASRNHGSILLERLRRSDLHAEVEALVGPRDEGFGDEASRAMRTLRALSRVQRHIELRIPRNLATSDDPQTALLQMKDKMEELRRQLEAHEQQLRERSRGVADGIRAKLRTATALVSRLSRELEQVSFGSIRGVRIVREEVPRMVEMLKALEDEESRSLFDTDMPLDEALARMYERIGGGRVAGSLLLDYRAYMTLRLEIRRIGGTWDAAKGVSTGEAIGIGAAILVIILRTWNDQARRISGSSMGRSMQQIFLDEANRLDQEALGTFTDFCERMGVQALVAAPELDKPRKSTVFVLERGMAGQREHVTIRGQRITA